MFSAMKRVIAAFLALIAVILLVGFLLPREFRVEQTIEIAAPPESIFPLVNDLANWQLWSPSWDPARNEHLKVVHAGQSAGSGAVRQWEELRGQGKLWITLSQPPGKPDGAPGKLEYRSEFSTFPAMTSMMTLEPVTKNEGAPLTRFTWVSEGALPSGPFYGWFSFLMKGGLGQQYARDLGFLKETAEKEFQSLGATKN